jgi:hypothetical protein
MHSRQELQTGAAQRNDPGFFNPGSRIMIETKGAVSIPRAGQNPLAGSDPVNFVVTKTDVAQQRVIHVGELAMQRAVGAGFACFGQDRFDDAGHAVFVARRVTRKNGTWKIEFHDRSPAAHEHPSAHAHIDFR